MPTSSTTMSQFLRLKNSKPMQETSSNSVGDSAMEEARGFTYSVISASSVSVISSPLTCILSLKR